MFYKNMNQDIAIKVENLTKIYKLYDAPIDRLKEALNPFKRKYHKDFYALDALNFEIKKGDCVGILGKNGAGKSTLLKIITGVLTPTAGNVQINGRISALLELGAGFNPEYTGMENIYFQGNLMGYSKEEIDLKIPAILEFADIGEFIKQPVKSYSSGMFARLAFAVAINVEPDILIVDEALSVGDAAFQNKCIRKMTEIMEQGVTVLFVSHDIQAVNKFCKRAIWLRDGKKYMDGVTQDVTDAYMAFVSYDCEIFNHADEIKNDKINKNYDSIISCFSGLERIVGKSYFGTQDAEILYASFFDKDDNKISTIKHNQIIKFKFLVNVFDHDIFDIALGVIFVDNLANNVLGINSYMYKNVLTHAVKKTAFIAEFSFMCPKIKPGNYIIDVSIATGTQDNHTQLCWINAAAQIVIISDDFIECGTIYTIPLHDVAVKYDILDHNL